MEEILGVGEGETADGAHVGTAGSREKSMPVKWDSLPRLYITRAILTDLLYPGKSSELNRGSAP
jgi:hypothetical protein